MKIQTVGALRTAGRTDVTKLVVAFRNFANAPKILRSVCVCNAASLS
jgi:hypothetical protein